MRVEEMKRGKEREREETEEKENGLRIIGHR